MICLKKNPRKTSDESNIDIHYMNVASSVQRIVEEVILKLCNTLYQNTKCENLCMAGGVALNCTANGKILKQSPFKSLWIQPAAGDAGGSLGAVYSVWHDFLKNPRSPKTPDFMKGALLGPSYTSREVEDILIQVGGVFKKYPEEELINFVIEQILQGKIVGWFQGAMEFGPRALGGRSILGDARLKDMQKKMNQKIKFRESFRPFAISILEEHLEEIFNDLSGNMSYKNSSPYMLLVSHIVEHYRKNEQQVKMAQGLEKQDIEKSPLPSCTHVDYSCRIQTVGQNAHPLYKKLLEAFYKKTNCPGIINTSFNVRGEPIVCTPYQAYRCFMNTGIDICVINDCILIKEEQNKDFTDTYVDHLEKD